MGKSELYVILGAGVIGLTIALELKQRCPSADIIIVAQHLPGDRSKYYASPWAGANWMPMAKDSGPEEEREAVTYRRFAQMVREGSHDAGIYAMDIRAIFDQTKDKAGLLSTGTDRIWYDSLVPGGLRDLPDATLPKDACFGFDMSTFVIDTQRYLAWLQVSALQKGIDIRRGYYESLTGLFGALPGAKAYFNCTGIGAKRLGDVQDSSVYPQRGQILLVESPKEPIGRMYLRASARQGIEPTYVFPRGDRGGVILGGCRQPDNWDGEVDPELAEDIKRRCCALCPELGKPEDLKIIQQGVGLRPARKDGARVERELIAGANVVHAYGVAGAGYQCSWGLAKDSVDLVQNWSRL
ncbi:putative d-amino acid [Phaeomoniella chlamydospora]|uniref:Putative d-amino acid n=1 Tax=Phaeomoniella chlamydospora TaxID=158046 RepID=A0A0G2F4A2_PHACM|nr:putative d-amino acid [Phaeomoniella chlamydospora]